jgi:hypothetical protein
MAAAHRARRHHGVRDRRASWGRIFTIAAAASFVASRMRESEDLVRQKTSTSRISPSLSQYIVQHLRESLLVVDAADRIRLINESAAEILGDERAVPGALVGEVSPRLLYSLSTWRHSERDDDAPSSFVAADGARLIQPHFAPLGGTSPGPTLIFLEDTSLMAERVQQSKLAALGRLSASIAHEIRNPVGAMSHAGQLLAESPRIGPDERRLTDIIRNNSERVSTIINNVCSSRGARPPSPRACCSAIGWRISREFCETMQVSKRRSACSRKRRRSRSAIRSQPPAPGGMESVRQRDQVRRSRGRHQRRDQG